MLHPSMHPHGSHMYMWNRMAMRRGNEHAHALAVRHNHPTSGACGCAIAVALSCAPYHGPKCTQMFAVGCARWCPSLSRVKRHMHMIGCRCRGQSVPAVCMRGQGARPATACA
eukprot:2353834-Prymnesium_polylepis.1